MRILLLSIVVVMLIGGCVPLPTKAPQGVDAAATEKACVGAGGKYLFQFNECENISQAICTTMGGSFDECASACRHMPEGTMCTAQCVPVCSIGATPAPGK